MNTLDTLELARLCWPDAEISIEGRRHIGTQVKVCPTQGNYFWFDPSTDWNDLRRVEEIIWERDLAMDYLSARHELFHPEVTEWGIAIMTLLDHDGLEARATAALQVLRAQVE